MVEAGLRLGDVSHETLRRGEVSNYEIVDFAKPDVHELVQIFQAGRRAQGRSGGGALRNFIVQTMIEASVNMRGS